MKQKLDAEALLCAIGEARSDYVAAADADVHRRIYKFPVVLAAILLCMILTVSALAAADVEPVYDFLYGLSPTIAQKLKPVRLSCVDNGIELEIISANVEGDTAQVFLGLRDLEGKRVTADCDLYDSYSIRLPDGIMGSCSYSHFEESTGTAHFLVEITRADGREIPGSKLTFSVQEFLSGKQLFEGPLPLSPSNAEENPATQTEVIPRGYSWGEDLPEGFSMERFLVPGELLSPMEGVTVSAMGWVDGYLHIQTHFADILQTDAHGYVVPVSADGVKIEPIYEVDFWDAGGKGSYSEQVFAISPEALANCSFNAWFSSYDSLTRGDWEVSFSLG